MYMTGETCEEHNAYEGTACEELRCILQAEPAKNIMLTKAQPSERVHQSMVCPSLFTCPRNISRNLWTPQRILKNQSSNQIEKQFRFS